MKYLKRLSVGLWCAWLCALLSVQFAIAADFAVTDPGFFFSFNGTGQNPQITLVRGKTYTFNVSTTCGFHPFALGTTLGGPTPPGVANNNICSGTLTYTVPLNASDCVYYCSVHFFSGNIVMVDPTPPPAPTIKIVGLSVSTNIVLRSTGTNTWSVLPEFKTNATTTNWFALTVQTNKFASGTNETICGKPPGDAVFIRIRSQPK